MFSVTKTELNVFPLCTKNVWPTKSGVTIERRDQVLIGFLTPDAFILSIFSRRYDSTKGPFFNDLAINFKSEAHYCHDFFFARFLSKMNRSLGLCFERVLKPLANCPHGLTG
jgi:hypothetical protein